MKLMALRRVTTTPSSLIIFGRKFDNVMLKPRRCPCTASTSSVDEERKEHHNDNKNNKNRAYTPKGMGTTIRSVEDTEPNANDSRMARAKFPQDQSSGLVFLVDKPQEWTSFDVCAKIKSMSKKMGVKKIGHCGTPSIRWRLVCCWSSSVERQSWQTSTRQK